jgi:hypothetical protein
MLHWTTHADSVRGCTGLRGSPPRQVSIGSETYTVIGDGHLKATRRDQLPPDLRYFPRAGR